MSEVTSLEELRKKRDLENNTPSIETVLEKLHFSIEMINNKECSPRKVVILLLDDSGTSYDVNAVTGGLKAQEASFYVTIYQTSIKII